MGFINNLPEQCSLIGKGKPATDEEQRPLCLPQHLHHICQLALIPGKITAIARQMHFFRVFIINFRGKYILGNINHHRPRTAGRGNEKRFPDYPWQIRRLLHQVVVLGDRRGDAHNIRLLKGILANQGIGHLTGKADQRNRIHVGGGDAGNQVGSSRP